MSDLLVLTLEDSIKWNEYLALLPIEHQDVYFTPEYYGLYESNGDGIAKCFVFEKDGDIALFPFLINCINDLGYKLDSDYYDVQSAYGYGGVVSNQDRESFTSDFFVRWEKWCRDNRIVCEFIRFHPILENHLFSGNYHSIYYDRDTIYLDISRDIDQIWNDSYSSKCRNMIRKSSKQNYAINIGFCNENVSAFKSIYYATMERLNASSYYLFSEEYFDRLLASSNFAKLITVWDGTIPIASMLMLISGMYAHYHLSGRNVITNDNSLNNYILDIAIRQAKEMGCKLMHFGGGRTRDTDDSLLRFKQSFSKTHSSFYIGTKVHLPDVYDNILSQWAMKHPKAAEMHSGKLQGYRIQN